MAHEGWIASRWDVKGIQSLLCLYVISYHYSKAVYQLPQVIYQSDDSSGNYITDTS